ncbi:hypothetical protein D3C72_1901870 [compost metagenome]
MAQSGDNARQHQEVIAVPQGAHNIAEDENHHQQQQRFFTRQLRGQQGHDGCTDSHAKGIAADQPAGRRNGDLQIPRNLRQQPHNNELGGADSKCT